MMFLQPKVFWLYGRLSSGKAAIATKEVEYLKRYKVQNVIHIDETEMQEGLCFNLSLLPNDRIECLRRTAEAVKLLVTKAKQVCLCSFITPYSLSREMIKQIIGKNLVKLVYIDCSEEICQIRNAMAGKEEIIPFEEPYQDHIDFRILSGLLGEKESAAMLHSYIKYEAPEIKL